MLLIYFKKSTITLILLIFVEENDIKMTIEELKNRPFSEIITHIDEKFNHTPTAFINGALRNESDQNQGSAKVLFYAKIKQMSKEDTLKLFAEHYEAVLNDANETSHQNIRNFMNSGFDGLVFEGVVLTEK